MLACVYICVCCIHRPYAQACINADQRKTQSIFLSCVEAKGGRKVSSFMTLHYSYETGLLDEPETQGFRLAVWQMSFQDLPLSTLLPPTGMQLCLVFYVNAGDLNSDSNACRTSPLTC